MWELLVWALPWGGENSWKVKKQSSTALMQYYYIVEGHNSAVAESVLARSRPSAFPLSACPCVSPCCCHHHQIVSIVTGGGRLPLPPVDHLPGADTATFAASGGLVEYISEHWLLDWLWDLGLEAFWG